MNDVLAQSVEIGDKNPIRIIGPLVGIGKLADVFNVVLSFLFPLVGIVLLYEFVMAGYVLIRSDGAPDKVKEGKYRMTYAMLGLVILVAAFMVAKLVAFILGFGGDIF